MSKLQLALPASYFAHFAQAPTSAGGNEAVLLADAIAASKLNREPTGVWRVRPAGDKPDPDGVTVIHWPTLTQHLAASPHGQKCLVKLGYDVNLFARLHERNSALLAASAANFRTAYEALIPPGARIALTEDSSRFLRALVQLIPGGDPNYRVYRPGLASFGLSTTLEYGTQLYSVYNLTDIQRLLDTRRQHLPDLLILTLACLLGAAHDKDHRAWAKWGVGWSRHGLMFNFSTGFKAVQAHATYRNYIGGDYTERMTQWSSPLYRLSSPLNTRTFKRLDDITEQSDKLEDLILPYYALGTDADQYEDLFNIQQCIFYYTHKHRGLNLSDYLKAVKTEGFVETAIKIKGNNRTRVSYPVIYDARELGLTLFESPEDLNRPHPLKMHAIKADGFFYLSYPEPLTAALPALSYPHFFRPRDDRTQHINGQPFKITRCKLDANRKSTLLHNGVLYFHPQIWPEALFLLKKAIEFTPDVSELIQQYAQCFETFCELLVDPTRLIAELRIEGEWRYALDQEFRCPISLDTFDKRCAFVLDKAVHLQHEPISHTLREDSTGTRSKHLNSYDKFLLWYAATQELNRLGVRLNTRQQAEYVTKRFLWWRRAASTERYLYKVKYPLHTPYWPKYAGVDELLAKAADLFKTSFTATV